jgi:hypothetical protein
MMRRFLGVILLALIATPAQADQAAEAAAIEAVLTFDWARDDGGGRQVVEIEGCSVRVFWNALKNGAMQEEGRQKFYLPLFGAPEEGPGESSSGHRYLYLWAKPIVRMRYGAEQDLFQDRRNEIMALKNRNDFRAANDQLNEDILAGRLGPYLQDNHSIQYITRDDGKKWKIVHSMITPTLLAKTVDAGKAIKLVSDYRQNYCLFIE